MFVIKTTVAVISVLLTLEGFAEQDPAAPKTERKELIPPKVGLIALGPKPGRRYRMPNEKDKKEMQEVLGDSSAKGGKDSPGSQAVMLEIPEFAAPPGQVYFRIRGKEDKKWSQLTIGFNNQVGMRKVPMLKELSLFRQIEDNQGRGVLFKLPALKPNSQTLLFLTPRGKGDRRWRSSPKVTAVPLTWSADDNTRVLLINASNQPVLMRIGDNKPFKLAINSRKTVSLDRPLKQKRVRLIAKGANDSRIAIQDSIRPVKGLTKVYAFYQASPKTNGGRTLGVYRGGYDKPEAVVRKRSALNQ